MSRTNDAGKIQRGKEGHKIYLKRLFSIPPPGKKKWKWAELARRARLSDSHVRRIIELDHPVAKDVFIRLAVAFGQKLNDAEAAWDSIYLQEAEDRLRRSVGEGTYSLMQTRAKLNGKPNFILQKGVMYVYIGSLYGAIYEIVFKPTKDLGSIQRPAKLRRITSSIKIWHGERRGHRLSLDELLTELVLSEFQLSEYIQEIFLQEYLDYSGRNLQPVFEGDEPVDMVVDPELRICVSEIENGLTKEDAQELISERLQRAHKMEATLDFFRKLLTPNPITLKSR